MTDSKPSAPATGAQAAIEGHTHGTQEPGGSKGRAPAPERQPNPAGPHADPSLMNPDATPGAGTLAPVGRGDSTDDTSG